MPEYAIVDLPAKQDPEEDTMAHMSSVIAAAAHDPKIAATGSLIAAVECEGIAPEDYDMVAEELQRRGVVDYSPYYDAPTYY